MECERTTHASVSGIEIVALTLAHSGQTWTDAADLIPQHVWDRLHDRELVATATDLCGDGYTHTTAAGDAALFSTIERLNRPRMVAV